MPNFSNDPPIAGDRPGLRLVRTPTKNPLHGIVTSENLVGCPTHFFHNRTVPCEMQGCEICGAGHSWRWHGYLACVERVTNEHVLFEFTAQASEAFRAYFKKYDTLRGCLFQAVRGGQNYNSRVSIQVKPADLSCRELPNSLDLVVLLCHIWNVPVPTAYIEGRLKDSPHIHVDPNRKPGENNDHLAKSKAKGK